MEKRVIKIISLLVLFLLLVFAAAFGFYVFQIYQSAKANLKAESEKIQLGGPKYDVSTKDDYWFGSPNPKVTIIEFSDFACPNSISSFTAIRELATLYQKDIKLVFKDYPQFESSLDLANAARCAGEQGLFWPMHDKLFENPGIATKEAILEAAKQIGADENRVKTCFEAQKYQVHIKNDAQEAENLGLSGTPTWIINGYMVKGDIPFSVWDRLIKQLLNK